MDSNNRVQRREGSRYSHFLASNYWRSVRDLKIDQVGGKCEKCGSTSSLQLHHTTYEHHGDEMNHLEDLVVMCRECHEREHGVVLRDNLRAAILCAKLSPTAKIVGLEIAKRWSSKRACARIRLDTLSEAVGCSNKTITRAVNQIIDSGILIRIRTGRSSILRPGPDLNIN